MSMNERDNIPEVHEWDVIIIMSFVRWHHIIFQYIRINCDFTLTMKLPWFLLNLVWLCMTNIQAVKLWPAVWPCRLRCTYNNASEHRVIDVIILWRHSSLSSTSRTKIEYQQGYICCFVWACVFVGWQRLQSSTGRLTMRDWKMRHRNHRTGICRTGKAGRKSIEHVRRSKCIKQHTKVTKVNNEHSVMVMTNNALSTCLKIGKLFS